jgi:two-component system LytT family response regulator
VSFELMEAATVPRWSREFQARLDQALNQAKERLKQWNPTSAEPIVVRDRGREYVIPIETLDQVEAQGDYVILHAAGRRYLKLERMSALESALDSFGFVRVHRSRIVNLERIARIIRHANDTFVVLSDGMRVPMSRAGYARLLGAMTYANAPDAAELDAMADQLVQ